MYKLVISVLGTKGGTGKTTTAHLLSLGLAKVGVRPVLMTTDHNGGRVSLSAEKRPYITYSAQSDALLKRGIEAFKKVDTSVRPGVLVVDGGGNRPETDKMLASFSDLVLLPFRDSEEDYRVLRVDMENLPEAMALPSSWPTNVFARADAHRATLSKALAEFPDRVMKDVPVCRATNRLLADDPGQIDPQVSSIAKALAVQSLEKLGINPYQKI